MIAAIEQAIIDRITNARASLGYDLRFVGSYGGEFDAGVMEIVKLYPCMLVAFLGYSPPKDVGGNRWEYEPTFAVMVAAKNVRNEKATRQGAGPDVGTYQMVKDVKALLADQPLGLDLSLAFQPGRCRLLANGMLQKQRVSVLSQEFTCRFLETRQIPTEGVADFLTFHADWDVPAFTTLPTDALPLAAEKRDAEDEVHLSQS
jgi:phage gp37-like protein